MEAVKTDTKATPIVNPVAPPIVSEMPALSSMPSPSAIVPASPPTVSQNEAVAPQAAETVTPTPVTTAASATNSTVTTTSTTATSDLATTTTTASVTPTQTVATATTTTGATDTPTKPKILPFPPLTNWPWDLVLVCAISGILLIYSFFSVTDTKLDAIADDIRWGGEIIQLKAFHKLNIWLGFESS